METILYDIFILGQFPSLIISNDLSLNINEIRKYTVEDYQIYDKIFDISQYIISFILMNLFYEFSDERMKTYIFYAILWRLIGVCIFIQNKDMHTLIVFPDMVKELYLLEWYNKYTKKYNSHLHIPIIIFVLCYEMIKNNVKLK